MAGRRTRWLRAHPKTALALLILVVRDPVSGRLLGRRDLESALSRPALGAVPLRADGRRDEQDPRTLDAVRSLRAAVKNLDSELRSARVLGLTTVQRAAVRD